MGIILVILYVFALLFSINAKLTSTYNRKIFYFYLFICFVVAAFRSSSFPDYDAYTEIYNQILTSSFLDALRNDEIHGEIGFKAINWLLSRIYDDVIILMIVFSGLSLFLFYKICSKFSINPVYAWLIYFPYSFLLKDLAQIRNAVASLLVVYALLALTKIRSFIIFCFASFFFQKYAIVSSIALYKPKLVYGNFFWVAIIGMFFIPSIDITQLQGIPLIAFDLSRYANSDYVLGNSIYQKIKMLTLALFLSVLFVRTIRNDVRLRVLYIAFISSYFYYCLFFSIPIISQRLGGYLSAVEPFLFSVLVDSVSRRNSAVVYGAIILLSLFYFTFNLYSRDFLQGLFLYG